MAAKEEILRRGTVYQKGGWLIEKAKPRAKNRTKTSGRAFLKQSLVTTLYFIGPCTTDRLNKDLSLQAGFVCVRA